ncbi:MAG TPA: HlyD family efflux transporter periplasmic adaptor subunit [Terriglobia bacterium]|nr:HlyD family efflux transporter periplasmic adaptor subunit [Terriglobia bacterium]
MGYHIHWYVGLDQVGQARWPGGIAINSRFNQVITEIERPDLVPSEAPPTAPVAPVSPPPKGRRPKSHSIVIIAVVLALAAAGAVLCLWRTHAQAISAGSAPESPIRTAVAEQRDFVNTLRLSGTVGAVQSVAITAPMLSGSQINRLTITKLAKAGSHVHPGDLLVEFDRQDQIKTFLDKQAEYQDLVDQITKKQADEATNRAKDESELQQAQDQLGKAQLEVQKNEIMSRIDVEKNEEALEEAEANLKQLRSTFDLKRAAAAADIRSLEVQRDRAHEIMLHAQDNEQRMAVHSPIEGIVVLNNIWKSGSMGEVEEGDQVWAWASFMRVVDPAAMEVSIRVNQEDVLALAPGQRATVHLDAYPDLTFPAHLQELAPMGQTSELSDKVRTFTALYRIEGNDPRLVPDLSAAVDVELNRVPHALVVPRDCVAVEGGRDFVWVKSGLGFDKREVQIGPESDLDTVVQSGLKAGEVVLRGKA